MRGESHANIVRSFLPVEYIIAIDIFFPNQTIPLSVTDEALQRLRMGPQLFQRHFQPSSKWNLPFDYDAECSEYIFLTECQIISLKFNALTHFEFVCCEYIGAAWYRSHAHSTVRRSEGVYFLNGPKSVYCSKSHRWISMQKHIGAFAFAFIIHKTNFDQRFV